MRIRNTAIAGATALAVAFGGTTVATAAEEGSSTTHADVNAEGNHVDPGKDAQSNLSSKLGSLLDATTTANGQALFGSSKSENSDTDKGESGQVETWENQPAWAKALYITTIVAAVATFIGTIAGPLDNFIKYGPFSR